MKKLIVSMLLVVLLLTGCGKNAKLSNGEDVVASLENGSITANELYNEMKNRYALNVAIDMIDKKILDAKYESDKEEKEYIDDMKRQASLYYSYLYKNQYSSYSSYLLATYGVSSEDQLDPVFSLEYKRNKVVEEYTKALVSDEDVQKYYDNDMKGDMRVSHILITADYTDDNTEEEIQDAKNKALETAREVITKLENGEAFEELAKTYSKDSSAENGGDIGIITDSDTEPEFYEAAKKLNVGEYTKEPVETKYGYHIIKLNDVMEKMELDDIQKNEIREKLAKEKLGEDANLEYKALIEMRKNNKVTIEDKDINKQYENYLYNYE